MRRATAAAAAVLALAVGACGGGDDGDDKPEVPPERVVERYHTAATDPVARCATLSRSYLAVYGGVENCRRRVVAAKGAPPRAEPKEVRVVGGQACVRFELEPGGQGIAVLVREDGDWKIANFTSGEHPEGVARECVAPISESD